MRALVFHSFLVGSANVVALIALSCGGEVSSPTGTSAGSSGSAGSAAGHGGTSGAGSSGTSGSSGIGGMGGNGPGGTGGVSGQGGTGGSSGAAHTTCMGYVEKAPDWPVEYYNTDCSGDPTQRCSDDRVCCQNICYTFCVVNMVEGSENYGQCAPYLDCVKPEYCLPQGVVPWLGPAPPP
jgi:hypothetical protein